MEADYQSHAPITCPSRQVRIRMLESLHLHRVASESARLPYSPSFNNEANANPRRYG